MLFSFLVPVYNVEKYIYQCLESLLSQKGADFEIVLLDDGSTDRSGIICDEYAEKYPELVRVIHKENEGLLMTRRSGFRVAKGDYFICVDSDDYIKPDYLETVAKAIKEFDCDMLMFDYESFYPDGHIESSGIDIKEVQVYEGTDKKNIYTKRLLKNKYNNMWSKVVKREVVDLDFDYSIFGVKNMCEDAIQSYALYTRAKKIVFIPSALYLYRRDIKSITSNIGLDYFNALRVSYELGWKYIKLWDMPQEICTAYASRCVSFYCDFISWIFIKSGIKDDLKIKDLISEFMLKRDEFTLAVDSYNKKYLATQYLRLRNPIFIKHITNNEEYGLVKLICKIEKLIRRA